MKVDERQLLEIAELEKWLAQTLVEGESQSTEHLRLRVRVELGEQWLRTQWKPQDAEPVNASWRKSVRSAIAEASAPKVVYSGSSLKAWRWLLPAGLGLAALLAISVSIFEAGNPIESDFDFNLAAFEESADPDHFDDEFEDVSAELDDLLASTAESEWQDVLDDLEGLSRENEQ